MNQWEYGHKNKSNIHDFTLNVPYEIMLVDGKKQKLNDRRKQFDTPWKWHKLRYQKETIHDLSLIHHDIINPAYHKTLFNMAQ